MLVSAQGRAGVGSGRRAVDGREGSSEKGAWRCREHVHNADSIAMNTWFLPNMTTDAYDSEATRSRGFGRVHTGARGPAASRRLPEQALPRARVPRAHPYNTLDLAATSPPDAPPHVELQNEISVFPLHTGNSTYRATPRGSAMHARAIQHVVSTMATRRSS